MRPLAFAALLLAGGCVQERPYTGNAAGGPACVNFRTLSSPSGESDDVVRPRDAFAGCPPGFTAVQSGYHNYLSAARDARAIPPPLVPTPRFEPTPLPPSPQNSVTAGARPPQVAQVPQRPSPPSPPGQAAGVAAPPSQAQPSATQRGVRVVDSQFDAAIRFESPVQTSRSSSANGVQARSWLLRSWLDKGTGIAHHQIYLTTVYRDRDWWRFSRANDERARPLQFTNIRRDVLSCNTYRECVFRETVGASIDDNVLREFERVGFSVKFFSNGLGDDPVILLDPQIIRDQLAAIEGRRTAQPPARRLPAQRPLPGEIDI